MRIVLDATDEKLEGLLGEAMVTTQPTFTTAWGDSESDGAKLNPGGTEIPASGVTPVDVSGSPAAGKQRVITDGTFYNGDTVAHNVRLQKNKGGTVYPMGYGATVAAGASRSFDDIISSSAPQNSLLDGNIHNDTIASVATRGGIARVNSANKWEQLALAAAGQILSSNGSDTENQTLAALLAYLLTANGDTLFRDHTGVITRLAKGAVATVLTEDANQDPSWAVPAAAGMNGVGVFFPQPITLANGDQGSAAKDRIYIARIVLFSQVKVSSLIGITGGSSNNAHWGAGIYDTAGNIIVKGVTGTLGTHALINLSAFTATKIGPGVYLLAITNDVAAGSAALEGQLSIGLYEITMLNTPLTTFGYTATVSAAGVLPDSINTALTAVTGVVGPFPALAIGTTTW